ncbi:MAG: pyrroloquinoline quinone-dependent dehydrogenase [Gammaproteobacteria bacterium]|nr:pyrroloquinoline quinone-dependent dehydrogenase [Gammaproteobacteria bacterium]MDE0414801.1 pyrroloquinoline quinone-dependent dehydrogenase [Gammaproteobacteria bacterium]
MSRTQPRGRPRERGRPARIPGLLVAAGLFIAASGPPAHAQTAEGNDDAAGEWPNFGRDPGGSQYSPLDEINRENVGHLEQAWVHHSGDYAEGPFRIGSTQQAVPLMANGLVYFCTPFNRVFGVDAESGEEVWVFDAHAALTGNEAERAGERGPSTCRGVAYWERTEASTEPCAKRIFKGDFTGAVHAIDALTGEACRDFGAATDHPGYVSHWDYEGYGEGEVRGMSSPPVVLGDLVIAGSGSNDGIANANDGVVRAFDVRTGAMVWEFNPIPPEYSAVTGAANVWTTMSADPARNLVFLPTTSPSVDYYGGGRRVELPLANAVVAVDGATGKPAWSFQTVHHDLYDYDLPGHALLVTIRKDGKAREVAIQQTKSGHLFVFDRDTGEPVFPIEEQAIPPSDLPDETAFPTQPIPMGISTFARTELDRESLFGITALDRAWCRRRFDESRYDGLFTPPSRRGSILFPSALGGGNWGGAAFDPASNLLVIKAENLATWLRFVPLEEGEHDGPRDYLNRTLSGTPYRVEGEVWISPSGFPCTPPPWGTLSAIDMDSGELRWQVPLGRLRAMGITLPSAFGWGSPSVGGPIVTAGGLVFVASTLDHNLRALDVETGEELWSGALPAPGMTVPITYRAGGRQYVVIAAGGNARAGTAQSDAVVAFALPD